jgi:hypothetical protein
MIGPPFSLQANLTTVNWGATGQIKDIRNDIMHFDPEGLDEEDLKSLRDFSKLMDRLRTLGAI